MCSQELHRARLQNSHHTCSPIMKDRIQKFLFLWFANGVLAIISDALCVAGHFTVSIWPKWLLSTLKYMMSKRYHLSNNKLFKWTLSRCSQELDLQRLRHSHSPYNHEGSDRPIFQNAMDSRSKRCKPTRVYVYLNMKQPLIQSSTYY